MIYPNDITPLTLTDYPGETAAVLWFGGCNLRCPYCYNRELACADPCKPGTRTDVLDVLKERKKLLSGVVLSGGEVTMQDEDELYELCKKLKEMGYKVKIDTNGSNPEVLDSLINRVLVDCGELVDYVALDHKYPRYKSVMYKGKSLFNLFTQSHFRLHYAYLTKNRSSSNTAFDYEIRTTVHPDILTEEDVITMIREARSIGYHRKYYLQAFQDTGDNIGGLKKPDRQFNYDLVLETCENVEVRGL